MPLYHSVIVTLAKMPAKETVKMLKDSCHTIFDNGRELLCLDTGPTPLFERRACPPHPRPSTPQAVGCARVRTTGSDPCRIGSGGCACVGGFGMCARERAWVSWWACVRARERARELICAYACTRKTVHAYICVCTAPAHNSQLTRTGHHRLRCSLRRD